MPKILVLYHSTYGHIEQMAYAVAEGARQVEGAVVDVKRVPETVPDEVAKAAFYKMDQEAPIAQVSDLPEYDAIIIGAGTRFGTATSQMRAFLDQTGGLWASGALLGKVGGAFTASATQHGGQETTFSGFHNYFLHQGMVVVGLPYAFADQMNMDEIVGGTPYGATTLTKGDGSRQPSQIELDGARFQGKHIAEIAKKLHG
ncbi:MULTISPECIES: NAD(P)H:quinone oxidoreductase [unclassified Brevundimonas]|uniref:NAD(P)H:quinone oxidoreductase n=1 Tax=unclassified Brevundimonas TaxID=2622653 RepID=UPI0025C4DFEF|nr:MULTISPECIES: NAD(P)H:quinone oxidoreductase [unclassified Brevundimonas]